MKIAAILGAGELGRELVLTLKDKGVYVVSIDKYETAPAFSVSDEHRVIDMTDEKILYETITEIAPDYIIPEIEAINIEAIMKLEDDGFNVVPSAKAIYYTMNRKNIRTLVTDMGIDVAKSFYATTFEEVTRIANENFKNQKFVMKPLMSSSGKGQTIFDASWDENALANGFGSAIVNSRGSISEVILEEFIDFDYEITVLYSRTKTENIILHPIVHTQINGDFQESMHLKMVELFDSGSILYLNDVCGSVTEQINDGKPGWGIYGIEFFVTKDNRIVFSELSPRPHDTGFVTKKSSNCSEFEIHTRALLGMVVPQIETRHYACVTINYPQSKEYIPELTDESLEVLNNQEIDYIWFNKKEAYPGRRMGIIFGTDLNLLNEIKAQLSFRIIL